MNRYERHMAEKRLRDGPPKPASYESRWYVQEQMANGPTSNYIVYGLHTAAAALTGPPVYSGVLQPGPYELLALEDAPPVRLTDLDLPDDVPF